MDRKDGEKALRERIREGKVSRADVTRRLAELAFGKANDCVRLALEDDPKLGRLDLSLLSEVKRNDKGTVEIKLIDRLKALDQRLTESLPAMCQLGCSFEKGAELESGFMI